MPKLFDSPEIIVGTRERPETAPVTSLDKVADGATFRRPRGVDFDGFIGIGAFIEQDALTTKDTGTANSGDATTDGIIDNNRDRIEEIETALKAVGILPQ